MIKVTTEINITMADIVQAFNQYRQLHNQEPDVNTRLSLPAEITINDTLSNIIKEYDFKQYDAKEYNTAFTELVSKGEGQQGSFIYDLTIFNRYSRPMLKYLEKTPVSTLQIGPGGSLGCEVLFSLIGVKEAYTLDPFPLLSFDLEIFMNSLQKLFQLLSHLEFITGGAYFEMPEYQTLDTGHYRVGDCCIRHFGNRTFEDTGFADEKIDFLFSHATFEHVRDPVKCIKEIKRILKPGGLTAHCIDLRDHRDFNRPLEFLRESEESWRFIMDDYCRFVPHGYMNRFRASEFRSVFESEGFEILEYIPEMRVDKEEIESVMQHFDERFRVQPVDDLAITTLFIVARKK